MERWTMHYLNARGALDPYRDRVDAALREVARRAGPAVTDLTLDIAVRAVRNGTIGEIGHVGHVPGPGVLTLTLDPYNPNLPDHLGEPLERMIAHELHHLMRFETVGYGPTLGEVLVSEGLACRFVDELYASDPEPWERAVPRNELGPFAERAVDEADNAGYDHIRWFFGGGDLPRWIGYTLGRELVGDYLEKHPDARPSTLADVPGATILPSLRALAER